jgi:hypothetical protein
MRQLLAQDAAFPIETDLAGGQSAASRPGRGGRQNPFNK